MEISTGGYHMIKNAVRYLSKGGHTKAIAEAIAKGAEVHAISITEEPELKEKVSVLFLGGAPYANVMAPELRTYAKKISPDMVDRIVLFTTSNWSHRTVKSLRKIFVEKGIEVENDYFYSHMFKVNSLLERAQNFGWKYCKKTNA